MQSNSRNLEAKSSDPFCQIGAHLQEPKLISILYGPHMTRSSGPLIKDLHVRICASQDEIYVGISAGGTGLKDPNTCSGDAITYLTSLLPAFRLFVVIDISRWYSVEIKRSSVIERS
jgi:hypothetical protein